MSATAEMKRTVEVFTAGCPACSETVDLVRKIACESCEIHVRDMNDADDYERARELGIHRVPAVAINGTLAACCAIGPVSEETLRAEGIGEPI